MIRVLPKAKYFDWMRRLMLIVLMLYAATTTLLLIRFDPKPVVIGIDPYGTRIVGSEKDPILKIEKENFIKRVLVYLYNYDETNFDDRISMVGDFMAAPLWERKKAEYLSISTHLKEEPLTAKGKVADLREVDETHFEADVEVHIQSKLRKSEMKFRVLLELKPAPRTTTKPYPWEVIAYDEQTAN